MPFRKKDDPAELQAYVKLMTEHQGNLRAFIVSLMPGSPDVADVVQETNAVLWQKRDRFEHGTNFLAWAFKIARYEVMHQRDRNKRDQRLVFSEKLVDVLTEMDPPEESDEALMAARDSCLAKLTEEQRQLVEARYTPGSSLEQLAQQTGSEPGSLRVALHRIRVGLKTMHQTHPRQPTRMNPTDLESKILQMLDGELSTEGVAALELELLANVESRESYKELARSHSALEVRHESRAVIASTNIVPIDRIMARQRKRIVKVALAAAAAIVLVSVIALSLMKVPDPPIASFRTSPGSQFTLTHQVAEGEEEPEGKVLAAGSRLRLQRGTIEGEFESGVRVVIEAPCDLRVLAEDRVALGEGVAWFEVPEKAVGFSALTGELEVVDLGTTFGIYAAKDQRDEVHVTQGAVEVRSRVAGGASQTLREGEALQVDQDGNLHEIAIEADRFATHLPEATRIAIANSGFEEASDPATHGNLGTVVGWTEENAASVFIDDNGRTWQPDRDRSLYLSGGAAAVNQNLNHNWSSSDTYTLGLIGFEPQFRADGAGDAFRIQLRQANGTVLWDSGSQSLDGTVTGDAGNVSYTGSGHVFRWTIDATTFVGASVVEGSPLNLRIACADGVAYLDDVWLDVTRHP